MLSYHASHDAGDFAGWIFCGWLAGELLARNFLELGERMLGRFVLLPIICIPDSERSTPRLL